MVLTLGQPAPRAHPTKHRPNCRPRGAAGPRVWLAVLLLLLTSSPVTAETVRAGLYNNPPRLFLNAQGEPAGFWVDLLETIARDEGWRVQWVQGTWPQLLEHLDAGRIDVLPDIARTPERDARFAFSAQSVLSSWSRVYARPDTDIESILDLEGRRIGGLDGSLSMEGPEGLSELVERSPVTATLVPMPRYRDAFGALATGELDAVVANRDLGNRLYREFDAVMTPIVFQPAQLGFAYPRSDSTPLRAAVDAHLASMKANPDSVLYRLQARWLGIPSPSVLPLPPWAYWVAGLVVVCALALGAGTLGLNTRVRRRTVALRHSEQRIQAILDRLPGVAFQLRWPQGKPTLHIFNGANFCNDRRNTTDPDGERTAEIHPEDLTRVKSAVSHALATGEAYNIEHRIRYPGRASRWVLHLGSPELEDGNPSGIDGFLFDIEKRKQTEAALDHSEAKLAAINDASADLMIVIGADNRIQSANRRFYEATGYSEADIVGAEPGNAAGGLLSTGMGLLGQIREGGVQHYEANLPTRDGDVIPVEIRLKPLEAGMEGSTPVLAVMRDLTPLRAIEAQLRHQSTHDTVTGLHNREAFEATLEQAVLDCRLTAKQHALCYLDVDQFHAINDTAGHGAGDALLQQLAKLLRQRVRSGDTLARFGGDEFTLLLWDCDLTNALEVAQGHRQAIASMEFLHAGRSFRIGATIGVVPIDADAGDAGLILGAADAACQLAKESGRNRVQVHETEDTTLQLYRSSMEWSQALHDALEQERFELVCQPIVPATPDADQPARHEILIRMRDSNGRNISPASFLPVAERYGLITRIDQWVVENALQRIAASDDRQSRWSINLSGHSFASSQLLARIERALADNAVDPRRITFEVTETALVRNFGEALSFIERLRGLGCTFALDDFGSGLSSFGYLKHLQVDVLKLDGVFIRDLLDDPRNEAMVIAFTRLAQAYGLHTVAEFVNGDVLRERLVQLGVDYVQGFALGRPQPIEEVLAGAPPVVG